MQTFEIEIEIEIEGERFISKKQTYMYMYICIWHHIKQQTPKSSQKQTKPKLEPLSVRIHLHNEKKNICKKRITTNEYNASLYM